MLLQFVWKLKKEKKRIVWTNIAQILVATDKCLNLIGPGFFTQALNSIERTEKSQYLLANILIKKKAKYTPESTNLN